MEKLIARPERKKEQIMDRLTWEHLTEIYGHIEAEILQSYLQANNIPVELLNKDGMPSTYPFTVDSLGRVDVFVPKEKAEEARALLILFNTPPEEEENEK
jgi:hypothetical protein